MEIPTHAEVDFQPTEPAGAMSPGPRGQSLLN